MVVFGGAYPGVQNRKFLALGTVDSNSTLTILGLIAAPAARNTRIILRQVGPGALLLVFVILLLAVVGVAAGTVACRVRSAVDAAGRSAGNRSTDRGDGLAYSCGPTRSRVGRCDAGLG